MPPTGKIHSFETFGAADGPGLRLLIFLQGCPLRCIYCHNPDTWAVEGGREVGVDEIVARAKRQRPYFGSEGGATFTGGEPLLQAGFVFAALNALRAEGIHTALDTSGAIPACDCLDAADLILLDLKSPFPERYREITGQPFEPYLRTLEHLRATQKPVWIRQVVARGLNDTPAEADASRRLIHGLNVQRFTSLPYHALGVHKWEALGLDYPGKHLQPINPSA